MFKIIRNLLILFIIIVSIYAYYDSQSLFQAKFSSIDGLPEGAPVTAVGVKVGKVVSTKAIGDGVIVTIRITNRAFPKPPPGSKLTITTFLPARGRVLEIKFPQEENNGTESWLVQEPVSTDSWLHASLEILEGVKNVSQLTIDTLTPENVNKIRNTFYNASSNLEKVADNLKVYEENLYTVKEKLALKTDEAKALVNILQGSVDSLNEVIGDKKFIESVKGGTGEFKKNLDVISKAVENPNFIQNTKDFKIEVVDNLNKINSFLAQTKTKLQDKNLKDKVNKFSDSVAKLNDLYDEISKKEVENIVRSSVKEAKNLAVESSDISGDILHLGEVESDK